MTLDQYVDSLRAKVTAFKADWLKCHKKKPEMYPMDFAPGDWDEQFEAWCSMQEDDAT